MPPMFPTLISNAMPTARLLEGASEFAIQDTRMMKGQYKPPATGNRNPYVNPGYFGCGIASCAMKPHAAIEKPAMMKGDLVWALSDHHAKIMVRIEAKTYMGMVRSCAFAAE